MFARLIPALALAASTVLAQGEGPLRVDELVQERKVIHAPAPVYPPIAKQARIGGTVQLAVLLDEDGTVDAIRLISGHPFLVKAAIDAVKQWEYTATYWNGAPVRVATIISIHFGFGPWEYPPTMRGAIPVRARS